MTSFSVSIQMKANEQYSPVVLFIMLYTVVLVIMKKKKKNRKQKQMVPVLYQNHAIMPPRHSVYHGLCPFQL